MRYKSRWLSGSIQREKQESKESENHRAAAGKPRGSLLSRPPVSLGKPSAHCNNTLHRHTEAACSHTGLHEELQSTASIYGGEKYNYLKLIVPQKLRISSLLAAALVLGVVFFFALHFPKTIGQTVHSSCDFVFLAFPVGKNEPT